MKAITVQELINLLQKVEDKTKAVEVAASQYTKTENLYMKVERPLHNNLPEGFRGTIRLECSLPQTEDTYTLTSVRRK